MTELRPAIIRLIEEGNSGEKIGKLINISPSTAREVIRRFKATGR
jgi:transposase